GVGTLVERTPESVVRGSTPPGLSLYPVQKGSLTVDGISLTVVEAAADGFTVALMPTTLARTTPGRTPVGGPVSLEADVIAQPAADRGRLRPARAAADAPHQHRPQADGVHGVGGRPRRRQHRHLGGGSRAHDPDAGRPGHPAGGPDPARARLPAAGQGGRRAA